jgi:hypothetical protein
MAKARGRGKKYKPYLPLGYGQASKYGIGPKGALLDLAVRYRLPVPAGIVLVDDAFRTAIADRLIHIVQADGQEQITAPEPYRMIAAFNLPNPNWEMPGPYAVRSCASLDLASIPDDAPLPEEPDLRGCFPFCLNVDPTDADAMAAALCGIWQAIGHRPEKLRRDVIVMHMVEAQHSGLAHTTEESSEDQVMFVAGDGVAFSSQAHQRLVLPKLKHGLLGQKSERAGLSGWQGRLADLLREVRGYFNNRKTGTQWEISWVDDGAKCWLTQLRPLPEK